MASSQTHEGDKREASEQDVLRYLKAHPDFLKKNPAIMDILLPPARELGESVVDFQHFQLKAMQKNSESLKTRYEGLVDFCRDNLSAQAQVHEAVLKIVGAHTLEQLLQVITIDMVSLFDVDVVRLAVESEAAGFYETYYSEHNYSGIVFIESGTVEALLPPGKPALLVGEANGDLPGFDRVFADCSGLIRSAALLKMSLAQLGRDVLLAFGVRHAERFHAGQGVELLAFLADVIALQLDAHLQALTD